MSVLVFALARLDAAEAPPLPPAANRPVDFARDIKPMLESGCIKCHAHGQRKGGFQVDSRELFLKGGESGPAALAGRSAESLVVKLVAGQDPDRVMPAKGPRFTAEQVGLLRAWIDQQLPWPEGTKLGRGFEAPLAPRLVELPPVRAAGTNPVDRLLAPYFARTGFQPPKPVADAVFARRAFLDVIGLPPSPEELSAFERDGRKDKRARLVQHLLHDDANYAAHWLTFWNDALRNDYRGTGFIDGGRKQITPWLYAALATNLTFDRFVAQLVNPDEHAEGFTKGIVWRGVVNASQSPPIQAAQNISQVFLGINVKCASCHDSFISNWKLADAYGLAGIYSDTPLELVRCDKPLGETASRKFLFPQLGSVADSTNRAERLASLARVITSPQNGRLTRTIVNRLWAKFYGRGLIEPVDEMDNPPWNADLLDWLAEDLATHGYDLKRTMALLLTSRAYQLPAVSGEEQISDKFAFRGPVVKRLTAEQYVDSLSALTGLWQEAAANDEVDFTVGHAAAAPSGPAARWIWSTPDAEKAAPPGTIYLRREFELAEVPRRAVLLVTADNRFKVFVNGHDAGSGDDWNRVRSLEIQAHLRTGRNVLAIQATNGSSKEGDSTPNPAGLIAELCFPSENVAGSESPAESAKRTRPAAKSDRRANSKAGSGPTAPPVVVSDRSWVWSATKVDGWEKPDFTARDWSPAVELGGADLAPWKLARRLVQARGQAAQLGQVRVALVNATPLQTALGRPNREQVVTSRNPVATTLQALELTNGASLADWLARGADRLLADRPGNSRELVVRLYRHGLGRSPTAGELELARATVGEPLQRQGVQDFLWALSLLPEFQLIY